jgi:DNA-binding transcriptional MerR regulator
MPDELARTMTLGRLARLTGLARASLLHYESLGLLKAGKRSAAGYRLYSAEEVERLRTIRRYRDAGLSLKAIGELLMPRTKARSSAPAKILEERLLGLCKDVEKLRAQQQQLARLLATPGLRDGRPAGGKKAWTAMLQRAGMSDEEMHDWHKTFESDSPHEHASFLRSLGLDSKEVARIRRWSRHSTGDRSE